jgi:hypothetical protein
MGRNKYGISLLLGAMAAEMVSLVIAGWVYRLMDASA